MSSDWTAVSLDELTDGTTITYGVVKPGDECHDGVQFIRGGDVVAGRILTDQLRTITHEVSQQYSRTLLRGGELLVSLVGNPGEVAIVPPSLRGANIARQVGLVRVDAAKANASYVQFFLRSQVGRDVLLAYSKGSVQQVINLKDLKSVKVPLPPVELQRSIAGFMQAIDDRITLLRETNATLEAIAQALFKSWFVDFDPVRARMDGRAPEGMDEATAALFPDGFEESELGLVPSGWRNVSLKEAVSIHDSKRIPLSGQEREKRKGPYPYYGAASLMDAVDGYLFDGVYLLTGEDGSVADTNGYPIMQYVWGKFWVNNHAHILQGKDGVATEHVMLAMQRTNITPYITGAVQAKLSQTNMWRINFLKPSREIAEHFGSLLEPLFVRFRHNAEQAQTLGTLRDTLLPRLISGQLRLAEADTQIVALAA